MLINITDNVKLDNIKGDNMEQNALIGKLQKKRNDLSELEKRVLDFILNDYELIATMTIDDIANR